MKRARLFEHSGLIVPLAFVVLLLNVPIRLNAEDKKEFARWEKDIAAFERRDKDKPPPKNSIVFVGSSSIRLWDLSNSFPRLPALNRGFGGSQLADSVHFAPRIVLKYQPRLIVLYAGDNDLAAGKSPERVRDDFHAFAQLVHEELPKARIVFISIKPSLARWSLIDKIRKANALVAAECKKDEHSVYLDMVKPMLGADGKPRRELFARDGLHLNAKGYELWAKHLKPYLEDAKSEAAPINKK